MASTGIGISEARIQELLVLVEASAEANNVPTLKRDAMIQAARDRLEGR